MRDCAVKRGRRNKEDEKGNFGVSNFKQNKNHYFFLGCSINSRAHHVHVLSKKKEKKNKLIS